MMEKLPKQQSANIKPIPFQNDNTIHNQLDNTGKRLFASQPKSPLHSIVYPVS